MVEIKNQKGEVLYSNPDIDTLEGANLRGANLRGADLEGANLSDPWLELEDKGTFLHLTEDDLKGTNLEDCEDYAKSSGDDLRDVRLIGARLIGARLMNANLSNANLSNADLSYADLSNATLYGANLKGANLHGVKLKNTMFDKDNAPVILSNCNDEDEDEENSNCEDEK